MSNFKAVIISSVTTFILVAISYTYFYAQEKTIIDTSFTQPSQSNYINAQQISQEEREKLNQELSDQRRNLITHAVQKVSPAVVSINVKEIRKYNLDPWWQFFYGRNTFNQEIQSVGSGSIISPEGYILTNDHVAGAAEDILITLTDGRQFKAKKVGTDPTTDICLLKIEGNNLPYVEFGNSNDIMIGEWSIAIGNPFGLFSMTDKPTVTVGVISALGMNLSPLEGRYYMNMIQTDASINQGNSGGPLINCIGQMIGMNTIIYTAQGSSGNVGVGFAIPVNKIQKIVDNLKKNGYYDRNYWTGLRIQDIDQDIAKYFDLSRARGVLVREVENGSPGADAGIKEYDIITHIDGLRVDNTQVLQGLLKEYRANESVNFSILRDGKILNIKMKLEKQ